MVGKINRRIFITGLGMAPLLGADETPGEEAPVKNDSRGRRKKEPLRIGIIGFGFRGEQLARACRLAHPDWIREQTGTVLQAFHDQRDLNIEILGISDLFDVRMERGITVAGKDAQRYPDYRELLASDQIDAVIIATPDHWHARMAMDAASYGKHIYLEKCMTRTAEEAVEMRDAVKQSQVVFQLGHQGRQRDLNLKAREIITKGTLGKLTLIETTTNRNDPGGAWIYPIPEKVNPDLIRWDLFQEPAASNTPFTPERFFRWRCFWDYGTGLAGDLLTHEYDAINSILDLGIPHSASASGGIYFYKDGREVPDVFHVSYEYPDRGLTLTYSGTLASGISRGTLFMGHDATLELGRSLSVWVDRQSTKYRSRIEAGTIDPTTPITRYDRGQTHVDAVSSATAKYFSDRGLMYTYRDGARVDPTNLHLGEWLGCIRNGGRPSCDIEQGFQEAITAHMATESFKTGRRVEWDPVQEKII